MSLGLDFLNSPTCFGAALAYDLFTQPFTFGAMTNKQKNKEGDIKNLPVVFEFCTDASPRRR